MGNMDTFSICSGLIKEVMTKKMRGGHTITDNSIIELFSWNKRLYNSFQSFNVLNVGFTYSWKNYKFLIEFKHFSLVDPVLVEFSLKIIRFIKINQFVHFEHVKNFSELF